MDHTYRFRATSFVAVLCALLILAGLPLLISPAQRASANSAPLPRLVVSPNGRFVQTADGAPFFWMGDTAWAMLHNSTDAELDRYLDDRKARGFNVVLSTIIAGVYGTPPAAVGCQAIENSDPLQLTPCYLAHVDYLVSQAALRGMYVALLPTWGSKVSTQWGTSQLIFSPQNARPYGRLLGERYRNATNVVWVLGADSPVLTTTERTIWEEMAVGIVEGVAPSGADPLIYYHPPHFWRQSTYFHTNPNFDLNAWQSGHSATDIAIWDYISDDYALTPAKPVFDSEPAYEAAPINWDMAPDGFFSAYDVRRQVYRSVFAGGFGVNYGAEGIYGWAKPDNSSAPYWYDQLGLPGATQMIHLRRLIESRPFFTRIPDQGVLASAEGWGSAHVRATRDSAGSFAMVYIPSPLTVTVNMDRITGGPVNAWWYNPQTGASTQIGSFPNTGTRSFTSPAESPDWVLVLDDSQRIVGGPGATPTPSTTPTPSDTPTSTATLTGSETPTHTPTNTSTPTNTGTPTNTPTSTPMPARSFYRGLNLNGRALSIDGNAWEGSTAANYSTNGYTFCNQNVTLNPATDAARAEMIRCSAYSNNLNVTLSAVPNGSYEVYLYVWEDNGSETFNVSLEGQVVRQGYVSGAPGTWARLGPWPATISDGTIVLTVSGGWANFSGVEVWRK